MEDDALETATARDDDVLLEREDVVETEDEDTVDEDAERTDTLLEATEDTLEEMLLALATMAPEERSIAGAPHSHAERRARKPRDAPEAAPGVDDVAAAKTEDADRAEETLATDDETREDTLLATMLEFVESPPRSRMCKRRRYADLSADALLTAEDDETAGAETLLAIAMGRELLDELPGTATTPLPCRPMKPFHERATTAVICWGQPIPSPRPATTMKNPASAARKPKRVTYCRMTSTQNQASARSDGITAMAVQPQV